MMRGRSLIRSHALVTSWLAATVLVVFVAIACKGDVELDPEIARLPLCTIASGDLDTKHWMKVEAPREDLTVELPPEFDSVPSQAMHGGANWQHGTRKLRLAYGYWSLTSFSESAKKCRSRAAGLNVVLFDYEPKKGTSMAAWFVGSGAGEKYPYDIVIGMNSARSSDRAVFQRIVMTASR